MREKRQLVFGSIILAVAIAAALSMANLSGAPKRNIQFTEVTWPQGYSYLTDQACTGDFVAKEQGFIKLGSSPSTTCVNEAGEGGACNGTSDVTLSTSQLPAHNHTVSLTTSSNGDHDHSMLVQWNGTGADGNRASASDTGGSTSSANTTSPIANAGAHTHTVSGNTANTGSGSAVNITPEHIVMRMCTCENAGGCKA